MGFAEFYFRKQGHLHNHLPDPPSKKLRFVVVIPAFNETGLLNSINCLWNCNRPRGHVEIIVVVNFPENAGETEKQTSYNCAGEMVEWIRNHQDEAFRVNLIEAFNLPVKHAGAGLARKTGMDEAVHRFDLINKPDGLIISFDADCLCDHNYFEAIEEFSDQYPDATGFNLYFEHPAENTEFSPRVHTAVIQYELHLRYVNQFLRYAEFPFAYHTVGSSFAVKAGIYVGQGGMNRRKAGEDFYFLHKIIPLGNFHEINTTRVIPSPRPSDRAPFGTGAAINKFLASPHDQLTTYHPGSFLILKEFFLLSATLYKKPLDEITRLLMNIREPLKTFLDTNDAQRAIHEINNNCSTIRSFHNRFFRWFDAFRVVKFLNYANHNFFSVQPIGEASMKLLEYLGMDPEPDSSNMELLRIFRSIEKQKDI